MFKRLVYTLPDLSPSKLVEHKKSGLISYFGVPSDRGMKPINFLAATEDYRVLHKGCTIRKVMGILRDARFFCTCRVAMFFSSLDICFFWSESVGIYFFINNFLGKFFFCFCSIPNRPPPSHHFSNSLSLKLFFRLSYYP